MNEKLTLREKLGGRTFKAGTYTVAVCLIALAVAVLVNVLAAKLPASYTTFDLSAQSLYTLSDQTKQVLSGLDRDVTVYIIAETGQEDDYLSDLLEQYTARSSHVKVVTKDPVLYPNFTSQYTEDALPANSVIVESDLRSTVVSYDEIYVKTYGTYYYYSYVSDVQFAGESVLTTAIDYVTTAALPTVYTLTGHGETPLNETLSAAIAGDNLTVSELSLLGQDGVPQDADAVMLVNPTSDLSADEAQMLTDYLEAGGQLYLQTDYTYVDTLANLQGVLAAYGLQPVSGLLLEGDSSRCYRYRNYLLPVVEDTPVTSALFEGNYYVFAPNAHGIEGLGAYRDSITITPLLTTSGQSYAKQDAASAESLEKADGDRTGPFNLGVLAQEEHDGVTTRIIWFGTPYLTDESADGMVSGSNTDLVLASLGAMAGSESSISIHSKSMNTERLTVPDAAASLWSAVFIGVIPALLLICGSVILLRRRKR